MKIIKKITQESENIRKEMTKDFQLKWDNQVVEMQRDFGKQWDEKLSDLKKSNEDYERDRKRDLGKIVGLEMRVAKMRRTHEIIDCSAAIIRDALKEDCSRGIDAGTLLKHMEGMISRAKHAEDLMPTVSSGASLSDMEGDEEEEEKS